MVCNNCICELKPDTIIQTWRNSIHKLVKSHWQNRTQDELLLDKLLWAPILDVFQVFGENFPISQDYLKQLEHYVDSVSIAGKYPAGDFFDRKKVEDHNEIKKFEIVTKKKKKQCRDVLLIHIKKPCFVHILNTPCFDTLYLFIFYSHN